MAIAISAIPELREKVAKYHPAADLGLLERAYEFARKAHGNQRRVSGEPYIEHPYHAALILAELQLDIPTLCAALLHDVPEDTDVTLAEIETEFGGEIARMVDGVTKLSRISWDTLEEKQAENLRKMFLAMAEDARVVLIKLADRLHNMRTLAPLADVKRRKISLETIEIFAPLAERLGIWEFKWELEDLAFRYLEPDHYREISSLLAGRREEREEYIDRAVATLKDELERVGIRADVRGRPKHLYSIAKKLEKQGTVDFSRIYDLLAVRVLVDDLRDCYGAIGVIHSLWKPIPGRFKDYIAMPKPNGYQSLHTTVFCVDGQPLEVQVRTWDMHRVAEYGFAAHWRYKEGGAVDADFDSKLATLRQLLDWQRDVSAGEFVESVKIDLFQDQIFVFTPKGEVKTLPAHSTPVDFAYRIHTDVGNLCVGAKVNSRLVSLDYQLRNGDIVEILTSKASSGPKRDWLDIVRTPGAREKIRQFLKRQLRDENIARGKDLLDRELRRLAGQSLAAIKDRTVEVAEALHHRTPDDMFAAIGYGEQTAAQVVTKLGLREEQPILLPAETEQPLSPAPSTSAITVKGVGDLLTRLANCCKPVPGDEIVGFITRGRGITVHRKDCFSIRNEDEVERLVRVEWAATKRNLYPVRIKVHAWDREGLLRDMATVIAEEKISLVAAGAAAHPDQTATLTATINIGDLDQLSRLFTKLERIKDVLSAERDNSTVAV
ncbi:MAG TPA: bifunctional (p)ppGpp synthetase/guanosine-3',5'-bis(diphosphate) 3'-pyrophosphohydrolase [Chloroflexota bacterium]|nr:bifunctional (p)ppGpp synthetase/guanosine-3',5'-bis(diphosphate) 3'-pyrophosphohydrolase [Chloroflexota bacterium]